MKKTWLLIPFLFLCSCVRTPDSSVSDTTVSAQESMESQSESESPVSSESIEDESSLDLSSLFDEGLLGRWYVTTSANSILSINDTIDVFSDMHMEVRKLSLSFQGVFQNYENSCKFVSQSGKTTIVLQLLDGDVAWGYEDLSGNSDFGYAEREAYTPGLSYDYEGPEWPMEQINSAIGTTGVIPSYEAETYKLHTGTSDLYHIEYAMVDIYGVSSSAASEYVSQLNANGFSLEKDPYSAFYVGSDLDQTYYLRITQYTEEQELCIFIYNYQEFNA